MFVVTLNNCLHLIVLFIVVKGTTGTSADHSISSNMTGEDHDSHENVAPICTYKHLEFCHPYIRNVFIMYTGRGGRFRVGPGDFLIPCLPMN